MPSFGSQGAFCLFRPREALAPAGPGLDFGEALAGNGSSAPAMRGGPDGEMFGETSSRSPAIGALTHPCLVGRVPLNKRLKKCVPTYSSLSAGPSFRHLRGWERVFLPIWTLDILGGSQQIVRFLSFLDVFSWSRGSFQIQPTKRQTF